MQIAKRTCGLLLGLIGLALPAAAQNVAVQVNGSPVHFDQPPVLRDGRVLVPVRGVFERMGADVVYVPRTRQVRATHGPRMIDLALGSRSATVDGKTVLLDTPAVEVGGRTMVPLRFISQALGANVRWSAASRLVSITMEQEVPLTLQPVPMAPPMPAVVETPLQVLAPLNDQQVPERFDVVVATGPGARVDFTIEVLPPGPGPYSHTRLRHASANADPNGRAVIPVRLHAPGGSRVVMSVNAVDASGRRSRTEQVSAYQI